LTRKTRQSGARREGPTRLSHRSGEGVDSWVFTGGVLGVLWLIDLIMIIVGAFADKAGNKVAAWV
jgi:hypothetical protein